MAKFVAFTTVALVGLLLPRVAAADDNQFLINALSYSTWEVKASELAAKQASSDKVKDFANRMVKDHGELNKEMLKQAKGANVAIVTGLEKDKRDRYDRLAKLKGNDFDREYMDWMVESHEQMVNFFDSEAKDGKLDALRDFAKAHSADLKKHLEEAKKIRDELKK
jgi:putative membrane protein